MFVKTEDTNCENCKYYFMEQCRRFPPTANGRAWPIVMPKDWCGEFLMDWKLNSDTDNKVIHKEDNFLNGWYLE